MIDTSKHLFEGCYNVNIALDALQANFHKEWLPELHFLGANPVRWGVRMGDLHSSWVILRFSRWIDIDVIPAGLLYTHMEVSQNGGSPAIRGTPMTMETTVYIYMYKLEIIHSSYKIPTYSLYIYIYQLINIPADGKPRERFDCLLPGESQSPVIYNIKCSSELFG